jgi:2-iminobutanoate/2-iminopropanoate deaminase
MSPAQRIVAPEVLEPRNATWTNAWRVGNEVIMSGMTAHPATQQAAALGRPLSTYEQTLVVLGKLEALVKAAGGDRRHIIKTVVYLTNIDDKEQLNRARGEFFGGQFPCSTLVGVNALAFPEVSVEIDAWAILGSDGSSVGK